MSARTTTTRRPLAETLPYREPDDVEKNDPEPAIGADLHVGSFRDGIRFVHVDDGSDYLTADGKPCGWLEYTGTALQGCRVGWPRVQFWAPLRRISS